MLGPFEISTILGKGGMGEVWKGRHRRTGKEVAVKVLLGIYAQNRQYLEGFHREIRSTASMNHSGIVQVYDHGVVSKEASAHYPNLHAGSPWLAMEFAEGGSLEEYNQALTWHHLQDLLLQMLDALAHAHARELVHRDLKPANVLRQLTNDGATRWILTDFGIAHVRDPAISERTADIQSISAGTPTFMAPEQLRGQWRSYGPWTDLYALGCMAYLLSSGRPPFEGDSLMAVAIQHLSDPVPPLRPLMAVPPGFENWLRGLLAKDIGHRVEHAADAAADLVLLGDPPEISMAAGGSDAPGAGATPYEQTTTLSTLTALPEFRTAALDNSMLAEALAVDRSRRADRDLATGAPTAGTRVYSPPPLWQGSKTSKPAQVLLGAGKGLFGLRQIPYVGRTPERDHLWREFCTAVTEKRPRCVVIRGEAGLGKSRLMNWVATRADELGVGVGLRSTHSPIMNATEGLPRMFQSYLGATGLDRAELFERISQAQEIYFGKDSVDPMEVAALVEWMAPRAADQADDGVPQVQLDSPLERYTLAQSLLRRIALRRPVVLCIDDGQWGQDSLAFARHLLADLEEKSLPVLIVVTVRPHAVDERLIEREYLELLFESNRTSVLDLAPLNKEEQRELIGHLMGLEPSLVDRIGEYTDGSPLFARQLIEDWVARDMLKNSNDGYILDEGEQFPANIHALLEHRLDEMASSWTNPHQAKMVMETAAALGMDVDRGELIRVCTNLYCPVSEELRDHLMMHGLAVPRSEGWRFRLPLYRDCLESMSRREGRWQAINAACARVVDIASENGTCLAERRARHFLAAEDYDQALSLLWIAADSRRKKSAYIQALALLSLIEDCFENLDYPPAHRERARLQLRRAEALRYRGDFRQALQLLDSVLTWQGPLPDDIRADTHRMTANTENFLGEPHKALGHYEQAEAIFESIDDGVGLARTLHGKGWIYLVTGHLDLARKSFADGFAQARQAGDDLEAAWCAHGMAEACLSAREFDGPGPSHARQALTLFDKCGSRSGMALAIRSLGDFARHGGRLEEARDLYHQARHFAHSTGHVLSVLAGALLGFCDIEEGKFDAAARRFEHMDSIDPEQIFPLYRPLPKMGLLVVAANRGDWSAYDELLETVNAAIPAQSAVFLEAKWLLEHAATACLNNGHVDRARATGALLERLRSRP